MTLSTYELQARFMPLVVALLPAFICAALAGLTFDPRWFAAGAVPLIGIHFLAAFIRDQAKEREPELFEAWGGKPTTQLLRHRDDTFSPEAKNRCHSFLAAQTTTARVSEKEEEADQAAADSRYDEWIAALRNLTYSKEKFPLVFAMNVRYGRRRNSLAARTTAIAVGVASAIAIAGMYYRQQSAGAFAGLVICVFFALVWALRVNENWVRSAAFDYARQIIESIDLLRREAKPPAEE